MRKYAFFLTVILIFAVISTAGCINQVVTLDIDKEPYTSTTMEIGGFFSMYAYDDFDMWEYFENTTGEVSYGITFNEGFIPENDWKTKGEEVLTAVKEYHTAKYADAFEIKDVTIREQYEDGLHKAYWTYLSPGDLTFSVSE